MNEQPERARATLVILPCPTCGRAVKVFGKVRRVLCACGEVLVEIGTEQTLSVVKAS